jgi:opacity protein-like surface antigen
MKILATAAAVALLATPTLAGDWTGAYVGGQVGWLDVEPDGFDSSDDTAYGLHAGYDYDFGNWVVGGELEYDWTDLAVAGGAANVDSVVRAKLKVGYDFGRTMAYAVAGAAEVDTTLGSETGGVYGIGLAVAVTDNLAISGELLRHDFSDIGGSGIGATADSYNLRASWRF